MAHKNYLYPHLIQEDIDIWEAFLARYTHRYTHFDYDVRVGRGRPIADNEPDNIKKMAADLSRRRIDAIGYTTSEIHIIEITQVAGLKAIGQLFTYPTLYALTYKPLKPIRSVLVCETLETDIEPILANSTFIRYFVHPAPPHDDSNQPSQPITPTKQNP